MADTKISALTAATTPLAGTEVVPIVQGGVTKNVPVNALANNSTPGPGNFTTLSSNSTLNVAGGTITGVAADYLLQLKTDHGGNPTVLYAFDSGFVNGIAGSPDTTYPFSIMKDSGNGRSLHIAGVLKVDSDVRMGGAGSGVAFTANTPAAGMTSQLLNWYEEGTWTPTDQSGAGLTFASVDGYYTKIGRQVFAHFYITYPITVDASNNAIGGLPFTAANTNAARGGSVLTYSEFNSVSSIYGPKNNTLFSVTDGVGNSRTNAVMSGRTIMGCIVYFV